MDGKWTDRSTVTKLEISSPSKYTLQSLSPIVEELMSNFHIFVCFCIGLKTVEFCSARLNERKMKVEIDFPYILLGSYIGF